MACGSHKLLNPIRRAFTLRTDTSDVAFRLLLALGEIWDGLDRAGVNPSSHGLNINQEYFGGYTRYSVGPGSHARLVFEWNESSRHLRVIRCEPWPSIQAAISATVAHVRAEARRCGIIETVDRKLVAACQEPGAPCRRTVLSTAMAAPATVAARRT